MGIPRKVFIKAFSALMSTSDVPDEQIQCASKEVSESILANRTVQVVITCEGSTAKVYVNGDLIGTYTPSAAMVFWHCFNDQTEVTDKKLQELCNSILTAQLRYVSELDVLHIGRLTITVK